MKVISEKKLDFNIKMDLYTEIQIDKKILLENLF